MDLDESTDNNHNTLTKHVSVDTDDKLDYTVAYTNDIKNEDNLESGSDPSAKPEKQNPAW